MTAEEIEIEVWRRYPKNSDERRGCQTAITIRNSMRSEYRKWLQSNGGIKSGIIE